MFLESDSSRFRASYLIIPFLMPALLFGQYQPDLTISNVTIGAGEIIDFPGLGEVGLLDTSGSVEIESGGDSIFTAQDSITLNPGFRAHAGSLFNA